MIQTRPHIPSQISKLRGTTKGRKTTLNLSEKQPAILHKSILSSN
jgi:hypothetical protein